MRLIKYKAYAATVHLALSALVVGLVVVTAVAVWYPGSYKFISNPAGIFGLLVGVDLIVGPVITFITFRPEKRPATKILECCVIGFMQLTALSYGVYTAYQARPVYVVFELDRFRAIHAAEVPQELLHKSVYDKLPGPLTGPTWLAVRPFKSAGEKMDATMAALAGLHLGARPDLWAPYESACQQIQTEAKPLKKLISAMPQKAHALEIAAREARADVSTLSYLPLVGRGTFWTALLPNNSCKVVAFAPVDPYD